MPIKGLLLGLRELRHSTSPAIRDVAETIERDPGKIVGLSVRDLAAASRTSPSSVVRLCRKLGCEGYREFQRELVYELASMDGINDVALEDIVPDDDADSVLGKVLQSDVRSMEATARLVDPSILMECARYRRLPDGQFVRCRGVAAGRDVYKRQGCLHRPSGRTSCMNPCR